MPVPAELRRALERELQGVSVQRLVQRLRQLHETHPDTESTLGERFFVVDGPGFLYRAFHALPPLSNSRGEPTGAVLAYSGKRADAVRAGREQPCRPSRDLLAAGALVGAVMKATRGQAEAARGDCHAVVEQPFERRSGIGINLLSHAPSP